MDRQELRCNFLALWIVVIYVYVLLFCTMADLDRDVHDLQHQVAVLANHK